LSHLVRVIAGILQCVIRELAEGDADRGGEGEYANLKHGKSYVCQKGAREE
jgi:hypothetical protein